MLGDANSLGTIVRGAAITRKLPRVSNRLHNGSSASDYSTARVETPDCAARVIASASWGSVPPTTEYQASQPAFKPVAASGSAETPMVTSSGRSARRCMTRSAADRGSAGTAGILIDATWGSDAMDR